MEEGMEERAEHAREQLREARSVDYFSLLGDCKPYYLNLHLMLDRMVLAAFHKDIGKLPSKEAEEQKEEGLAAQYSAFVKETRAIEENLAEGDQPDEGLRESAEIEIDADYQLRYEEVIRAITAVTGYKTPEGEVIKLIEKIRFSPPKSAPQI